MWISLAAVLLGTVLTGAVDVPSPLVCGSGRMPVAQEAGREKVDVNKASFEQLQEVPGIGSATAQRIVEWREQHGPFETLDDLLNVRGIGVKNLEKLRPFLTVGQ